MGRLSAVMVAIAAAALVVSSGAVAANAQVDPSAPAWSVSDVTVIEGDSGETEAAFTLSLSHAAESTVRVRLGTVDGTAAHSDDYVPLSWDWAFPPGVTSQQMSVAPALVLGDTIDEPDETFTIKVSNPTGGTTIAPDGDGVVTIVDDDEPPAVSVGDVSVVEGDAGETEASVAVSLDHAATSPVSLEFTTADGTAAGSDDYVPVSGLVNFAPGETSQQIPVPVIGDIIDEPDETFTLELSNPTGATIADGQGVATILDDDELVPTSTEVTGAPNPSKVGKAVAITATVSGNDGVEPAGTVTFYDGPVSPANALGTVVLDASGIATLSTDDLAVGSHTINAVYNPDAMHSGSSASYTQTVRPNLLCVSVTVLGLPIRICL
jgi:hypothetical protein